LLGAPRVLIRPQEVPRGHAVLRQREASSRVSEALIVSSGVSGEIVDNDYSR